MRSRALIYLFIYCRCNQGIPSFIYSKRVPGPTVLRIFINILSTATLWVVIHPFIRQSVTLWVVIYLFILMLTHGSRLFIYSLPLMVPADCLFINLLRRPFWRSLFVFPSTCHSSGSKQGIHSLIHFLVAFLALVFYWPIPVIFRSKQSAHLIILNPPLPCHCLFIHLTMSAIVCPHLFIYCRCNQGIP